MTNAVIKKAKLVAGMSASVSYTLTKEDGSTSDITENSATPIHEDLKKAFAKLNVHLGVISEIIPEGEIDDIENPSHELLDSFRVTEFELMDHESGVKLAGSRTLSTGKHLSLKTPGVKYGGKKKYTFVENLGEIIEECRGELHQYLFNGKRAPDAQTEIEFPEGESVFDDDFGEIEE